jgi:hypothetical protein
VRSPLVTAAPEPELVKEIKDRVAGHGADSNPSRERPPGTTFQLANRTEVGRRPVCFCYVMVMLT